MRKVISFMGMFLLCTALVAQSNIKNRIYEVWDDQPAPNRGKDYSRIQARGYPADPDWEAHSYPIGNGYMGANIFGRTDVERIQVTEKTLTNGAPYGSGGMTNFAEVFLEFDHYEVNNYKRTLNLNEAISYVSYEHKGVKYFREYLANYPQNVIAIKLSASEKAKISCTVSAVVPYLRSDNAYNHSSSINKLAKYATTRAHENSIIFSGTVPSFSLNYEGQIRIINDGGKLIPNNENGSNEIRIVDANSAIILIATGTNYKLSDEIFLTDSAQLKLNPYVRPHKEVTKTIENASILGYEKLKESHLKDYQNLFSRVNLELSPAVPQIPTKTLVENYRQDASDVYLEELMFHFGRYLLIASSREGTLPCTLQGVWSQYHVTPWSGGYWHNINVQMNYWGAFITNIPETFTAFEEYFNAYLPKAYSNANNYVSKWHPDAYSDQQNGNGWCIGTGANAYAIGSPGGHSGPGTGGFTAKLFWDKYAFTRDTTYLREVAYPALLGMSTFLSKTLVPAEDGVLLVDRSASPEQRHNGVHYMTKGTTFDQGFVWETYNDLLKSAKILKTNDAFLETVSEQINKLDPILIGESGQVKEYREEIKYGDIGDPKHRHISHLCPIYPGTLINSNHPEWVKAASKTLDLRGNKTTGWAMAHRMNVRARTKEAEKAHEVYSKFLKERTLPNLWTVHPPFQIDGNLGTMAGVAEMLIQSHEGFIELLPALPKAWQTGSFEGLVARGNFEINASWKDKKVTSFSILSRSGGKCSLKYPNIEKAQINNVAGDPVFFIKEGENMVSFSTDKLSKYQITLKN
jgi:alpha-L-fucosidase 2